MPKLIKAAKSVALLPADLLAARQPPIFVVGLPRSGTTWLASMLGTARSVKYCHEPFNWAHVPASRPHVLKYIEADGEDRAFARYCRSAFSGRGDYVTIKATGRHHRFAWWPARTLIKDVHVFLALDWIHHHLQPTTIIVLRHPCGGAESWSRLGWEKWADQQLQRLLDQPALMEDYLHPFEALIRSANRFFEKFGALWGACYHVMLQQQQQHPEWIVVQHETLCTDPLVEFRKLFAQLGLQWTNTTQEYLATSTTQHSTKPYDAQRRSAREPEKWQNRLTPDQIEQVRRFTQPFNVPYYAGDWT